MSGSSKTRLRDGFRYCLLVFLGLRVGLLVLGVLASGLLPAPDVLPAPPGWAAHGVSPGWHNLFIAFERQDALWFLRIAAHGYRSGDGSAAFFPLYPLLTRMVSFLLGERPLAAGIVVSNLSFLGALVVLHALTAMELGVTAARRTVLYVALFPTSFFFLAPYTESTFLLCAVVAFWAARRGRWGLAAAAGALAALTRGVGVVLAPALAVEAFHQRREKGGSLGPRLAGAAGPAVGLLMYLAFWQVQAGDWTVPMRVQANWAREGASPLSAVWNGTRMAFDGAYGTWWLIDWLIVAPVLVLAIYGAVRLRPGYGAYAALSLLVPLCYVWPERPFMSMPRFALPVFPVFWALAMLVERRRIPHQLVVASSAAGLGLLTVLFVNWQAIF